MSQANLKSAQEHEAKQKERFRRQKLTNQINNAHIDKMELERKNRSAPQPQPTAFENMMEGHKNKQEHDQRRSKV